MTIIEAIRSGKRMRRPCFPQDRWYFYPRQSTKMFMNDPNIIYDPDKEDILAEDWVIQEMDKDIEYFLKTRKERDNHFFSVASDESIIEYLDCCLADDLMEKEFEKAYGAEC